MSGSHQDDLLDQMLSSARRRVPPGDSSLSGTEQPQSDTGPQGLNPLDLLGQAPPQRDVINWLSRRKQARFDDLQDALHMDGNLLAEVLAALKEARHVKEALIEGEIFYRVVFAGKVSRGARGLPDNIWERVDLDNSVFLRQVRLFRGLADRERKEIADRLEARRYHRNEVIFWQGGTGEGIYLIKSGIVGITRLTPGRRDTQILSYLKQGDLLGEYGLLFDQNVVASATATALSEVDALLMKRQDVLELLVRYPSVAIELVQLLAQRLLASSAQQAQVVRPEKAYTLCLVIGLEPEVGCTTIGTAVAISVARATQNSTVYTEYPSASLLSSQFGLTPDEEFHPQSAGYSLMVPRGLSGVPAAVRTTLIMDRLTSTYTNIVIGVSGPVDDGVIYMLERADQVVIVIPPGSDARLQALQSRVKAAIHPENTNICVVRNHHGPEIQPLATATEVDFDLSWFESLPPLSQRNHESLPGPLAKTAAALADRLGRTNQIGIFIPAALEMHPSLNTQPYLDRTLGFLGKLFGSVAGYPSHTLTHGEQTGMAGENIYLVQTYVTKSAMDRHLGDVLAFVEQIKTELGQELLALEVNHSIMLV